MKALAEATYGPLKPNPNIKSRMRPQEPPHRAARRVELKDPRAGNASVRRFYLAPSMTNAAEGEAEALYLLMKILANGTTSRLYQTLVSDEKIASSAGGWYSGTGLDSGSLGLYAVAAQGIDLDKLEAGIDRVLHEVREKGVTADELERAKRAFISDFIYESDSQSALARRYGEGMLIGLTIEQINDWPTAIAKVTAEDVKRAADKHIDIRRSVTGTADPGGAGAGKRRCLEAGGRQVIREVGDDASAAERSLRQGGAACRPPRHRGATYPIEQGGGHEDPSGEKPRRHNGLARRGAQRAADRAALRLRGRQRAGPAAARRACRISWPACSTKAPAISPPSSSRSAWRRSPCA